MYCRQTSWVVEPLAAAIVTVAVALLTEPQEFDTRTQYDVVVAGETVTELDVAPAIGDPVFPEVPVYH
jgi:hypothetical protein